MRKILTFLFLTLSISLNAISQEVEMRKNIELDSYYNLSLEVSADYNVSITIYFGDENTLVEKYIIGNAVLRENNIQSIEIDQSNETLEVLLIASDRTSNYGARTGVLIYEDAGWRLVKIPSGIFSVTINNNIGQIEIEGNTYKYEKGMMVKMN